MGKDYDIVVVGAGVFGVPVAKTYLEVHPEARLLMLDAGYSVGGTWSAERLYDELRTNNLVGMLEFSDFPMDIETFGVPQGSHVPGAVMHKYLTAYTKHFGFFDKIRFGAEVKTAEMKDDNSWIITYDLRSAQDSEAKEEVITTKKLVLATGTSSKPNLPVIPGSEKFEGHIFHSKELGVRGSEMSDAKNVVVLGGSKSAADSVYLNAVNGRHVDWVMRASGKGPAWLSPAFVSPANLQFEKLATTRAMTFLSPSFDDDGYWLIRKLLHDNPIGRALLRGFFGNIHSELIEAGKFKQHPETAKLIPRTSVYWTGTTVGIFNYPKDFFELIRKGLIHVHIEDIDSLSETALHLANGTTIETDIVICATGWKHTPTIKLLPESLNSKSGLSLDPPDTEIVKAADKEIMQRWPELQSQPPAGGPIGELNREQPSWTLYRGTVPASFLRTENFAYCGMSVGLRGFLIGEITALWITALFDGKLRAVLPSQDEAAWQAMLQNRFFRWRSPSGLGPKCPDMVFELMPFIDTLMRDLGLPTKRKGGWREYFESYHTPDYKGIVAEWMEKEKKVV